MAAKSTTDRSNLSQLLSWMREDGLPPAVAAAWLSTHGVRPEHIKHAIDHPHKPPMVSKEEREANLHDLPEALRHMAGMDPQWNRRTLEAHGITRQDVEHAVKMNHFNQRKGGRYDF